MRITTATFVAPGGTVAERWKDGHAAAALRGGKWDASCCRNAAACSPAWSMPNNARRASAAPASAPTSSSPNSPGPHGARTLLLATWGPDEAWQLKLDRAIKQLASRSVGRGHPRRAASCAPMPPQHPQTADVPDKVHPSLPATLIMAAQLYRAITGIDAQARDVTIDFPLLPANALVKPEAPMEGQPQLAGNGKRIVLKADAIATLLQASKP